MRLISWNVAHKAERLGEQLESLRARNPDVIALQEVTTRTAARFRERLSAIGLAHIVDSTGLVAAHGRRYGNLIASRWPLHALPSSEFPQPFPERIVSAVIASPRGGVEVHNAHIVPGVTNGWQKIEMFEAVFSRLARTTSTLRILCGDFNSPQLELLDGRVVTWGQKLDRSGVVRAPSARMERWDRGERSVLQGLAAFDLIDIFRRLHGFGAQEWSWYWRSGERRIGRRFDHVFASSALDAKACRYLHALREGGLSDHSPIEVDFSMEGTSDPVESG